MNLMLGVLVNVATVIVGGGIGLLLKKGIKESVSKTIMSAVALCVLYIGIDNSLQGESIITVVVAMAIGALIGSLIRINDGVEKLGELSAKMFKSENGNVSVAEAFVTSTILFCVGAMTIVGAIESGINGNHEIYYTKAILDGVTACMLASTMGAGVLLSSVGILVVQGGLVLLSGLLKSVLTDTTLIGILTSCGGLMIVAIGLNMLGITKIKIADLIPAFAVAVPIYYLFVEIGVI